MGDVLITIDKASAEPIYAQLRAQIIAGIARGELCPGDVLPSVRKLAGDLGVNLHTVNKAYAVLRDEGYVAMLGRAGTIVADPVAGFDEGKRGRADTRIASSLAQLATEYFALGGTADGFEALASRAARAVCAAGSAQSAFDE